MKECVWEEAGDVSVFVCGGWGYEAGGVCVCVGEGGVWGCGEEGVSVFVCVMEEG